MQKFVSLIWRRGDFSSQQFRQYYEHNHAPLALQFFPPKLYQRNYVEAEQCPAFDCLTEFEYEDDVDLLAVFNSDAGPALAADEANFIAREKTVTARAYLVSGRQVAKPEQRARLLWLFPVQEQAELLSALRRLSPKLLEQLGASAFSLEGFYCENFPYAAMLLVERPDALSEAIEIQALQRFSPQSIALLSCPTLIKSTSH